MRDDVPCMCGKAGGRADGFSYCVQETSLRKQTVSETLKNQPRKHLGRSSQVERTASIIPKAGKDLAIFKNWKTAGSK